MSLYHRHRRMLLDGPQPITGGKSDGEYSRAATFDTNMVIILAALLCALICALGINSIVRCVLRCAMGVGSGRADDTAPSFGRKGLKKGVLLQIPVAVYDSGEGVVAFTECPICLGEFLDGEKIRVLPKCHHCFHVKCVDVWLASHTSCPTCRQSVAEEQAESGGREAAAAEVVGRGMGNWSGRDDGGPTEEVV